MFAADTRYSFAKGDPMDYGLKIFPVMANMGVAFSGRVATILRALSDLAKRLQGAHRKGARDLAIGEQTMADIFRDAHARQRAPVDERKAPDAMPLRVLVGHIGPDGRPYGLYFNSEWVPAFAPMAVPGICCIGEEPAASTARCVIAELEQERFRKSELPVNPELWQVDLIYAVRTAIEQSAPPSRVGGPVQSLVITRAGRSELTWQYTSGDPQDADSWNVANVPLSSLSYFPNRAKRGSRPRLERKGERDA